MRPSGMHYFPLAWPFIVGLFVLFLVLVVLIELRILRYAYERMGIPPRYIFGVLLLSLLGSGINIPVAELQPAKVVSNEVVDFYGVRYVIPQVHEWPRTIIAVNVGGGLIPLILSAYLLVKNRLYVRGILAVAVVTLFVHHLARPVRGRAPCKGVGFQWVQIPPGSLVILAGSSSSGLSRRIGRSLE
jgi:uncharacterized membrane protein